MYLIWMCETLQVHQLRTVTSGDPHTGTVSRPGDLRVVEQSLFGGPIISGPAVGHPEGFPQCGKPDFGEKEVTWMKLEP